MKTVAAYLTTLVDRYEGGAFTNDPDDPGGPTKWGVTQHALAAYRGHAVTMCDVRELTRDEALRVFCVNYVDKPGFRRIEAINDAVAVEVIDTGVNMGPALATRYLQRALNVVNHGGEDWPNIAVDGHCGPATADALAALANERDGAGIEVVLVALNCLQGAQYIHLAEALPSNEKYVYGWLRQRVQVTPC